MWCLKLIHYVYALQYEDVERAAAIYMLYKVVSGQRLGC